MTEPDSALMQVENGIAWLTLSRPDKLNALSADMHMRLAELVENLGSNCEVRVLVLTGDGRAFCSGQDLAERDADDEAPFDLGHSLDTYYNPLIRSLVALPFPTIAAVNGVAAGAGANIALSADIVVAKRSASFVQSFAKIGLLPDSGGTWTLPRFIGLPRALATAMTSQTITASDAALWGLIWKCVDDEAFATEVRNLAAELAAGPTAALVEIRKAMRGALSCTLDEQLDRERDAQRRLGLTADYREGLRAFKAKRRPSFRGR